MIRKLLKIYNLSLKENFDVRKARKADGLHYKKEGCKRYTVLVQVLRLQDKKKDKIQNY